MPASFSRERGEVANLIEYMMNDEAAELPGVTEDALRRWYQAGKRKTRRHPVTGYRLYLREKFEWKSDIEAMIADQSFKDKSERRAFFDS